MKATWKIGLKVVIYASVLFTLASCQNKSNTTVATPDENAFKPPVVKPLVFSKPQKINWSKVKTTTVTPLVEKFDLDKISSTPYTDSTAFKPFSYPVETSTFDYNTLPTKDFDIGKLPSKPLKFARPVINAPQFIKAGPPHISNKGKGLLFELSEPQGLAGVIVTALLTDHEGFLWIATDRGVYRYDGQNLVLYIPDPMSRIFCMLEDNSGLMWMSSLDNGMAVLDPRTGTLRSLSKKEGLVDNNVIKMLIDSEQRIWATTAGGINIIDTKSQTISTLGEAQGISGKGAGFIISDRNNNIWLSVLSGGVNVIDLKNHKIRYIRKAQGLKSDSLSAIFCDRQGRIWTTSRSGIFVTVFDVKNGIIQQIKEIENLKTIQNAFFQVESLTQDDIGNIWVGTVYNGVKLINLEKRQIKNITISGVLGDPSDFVVCINQDKNKNSWIGTVGGLYLYKPNNTQAEHIGNYVVSSLTEDNEGLLWEGDFAGLHIFDRKSKTVRTLTIKQGLVNDSIQSVSRSNNKIVVSTNAGVEFFDKNNKTIEHIGAKQGFQEIELGTVLIDKTGNIWVSSNHGIDIIDPQKKICRHLTKDDGLSNNNINDIHLDGQNRVWIGVQRGSIDIIDLNAGTISHLQNQPGLRGSGLKIFLHNDTGNVWIGTTKGIYIADQKNKTITALSTPQGLIDQGVISLLQFDSHIYAGTGKGISEITPPATGQNKNWKIISFGKDQGVNKLNTGYFLSDNITKDGLYLWGDRGISIIDLSPEKNQQSTKALITGFNLMDKPMYFGYQPDNSNSKNRTSSENNIGGNITGPYNLPSGLRLSYNQNNLQFHFAGLNLLKLDTPWYHYMLEGADQKWSDGTSETSTGNYFGLTPGKYTFKVAALGHNSTWGIPATFSFTVLPPWWQTWWAYLIYTFLFAGILWGFVTYRSYQLLKEKRVLEHKVYLRTQEVMEQKEEIATQRDSLQHALDDLKSTQSQLVQREKMASLGELTAGIAHEIQNPLNFVNNFSEVNQEMIIELEEELKKGNITEALGLAEGIKDNEEKINHHGKRADSIVKGMLQHSRNNSGERQPTDINALADEYLRLSYHGLRAKDKTFNAEMVTHFENDLQKANIIPQDIGRVLLNLYNNAFYVVNEKKKTAIQGFKPTVKVSTSAKNGQIEIKVKDNGNGIPDAIKDKIMQPFFTTKPAGEGTGLGLSLSYDIVVKGHRGNISIETKESEYTEFTVVLPIS